MINLINRIVVTDMRERARDKAYLQITQHALQRSDFSDFLQWKVN